MLVGLLVFPVVACTSQLRLQQLRVFKSSLIQCSLTVRMHSCYIYPSAISTLVFQYVCHVADPWFTVVFTVLKIKTGDTRQWPRNDQF